ncbi:MAG: signal peptidase I [Emergencia sp.]
MKAAKKGITVVISVALWIIILLAALFAFTTLATRDEGNVSSLAGFTPMVVESDSMAPTFSKGDLIVIKKCDTASLNEGDIITFHTIINNEYALNTHRIESIAEMNGARSYVTKGDNNDIADTHVIADGDIVGKYVTKVPGLGRVMNFLSGSVGFLVLIVLPLLLFFIYQVYNLIMVSINLKKAVAVEEAKERALAEANAENDVKLQGDAQSAMAEAEAAKAEAEAALAEAMRLKAEAEAKLAEVNSAKEED